MLGLVFVDEFARLLLRKESLVFIVSADPEPEEDVLLKKGERAVAVANSN